MNDKLKEFLDVKKADEKNRYEEEKRETLIDLGLFEKVYSPDNSYNEEFSWVEWDGSSTNKYYKKVPVEITDEEYQEVKKYLRQEKTKKETTYNNPIATALTVIAWVLFIGGFIAGIALGTVEVERGYYYTYTDTEFSFAIAFVYWCVSLISGTMFLGFAEIIKLLDAIKRK